MKSLQKFDSMINPFSNSQQSLINGKFVVDIKLDELETRGGTKEKGRLFALSSNSQRPRTLPRTISQDSDVQDRILI